jgi:hypothetical protein
MKAEVAALVEAFTRDIHEAVRLEIMEEIRAFSRGRQKREVRLRRPASPSKRKAKRRKVKRPAPSPVPYDRAAWRETAMEIYKVDRLVKPIAEPEEEEATPAAVDPPKQPVTMVPVQAPHPVLVRWDGKKHPRVALLVARSEDGEFLSVRLAQGRNRRYSHKVRRIIMAEFVRDATEREANLGVVPFDAPGIAELPQAEQGGE